MQHPNRQAWNIHEHSMTTITCIQHTTTLLTTDTRPGVLYKLDLNTAAWFVWCS